MFLIDKELRDEVHEKWDMILAQLNESKEETLQIKNTFRSTKVFVSAQNSIQGRRKDSKSKSSFQTEQTADSESTPTNKKIDSDTHLKPVRLNVSNLDNPYLNYCAESIRDRREKVWLGMIA